MAGTKRLVFLATVLIVLVIIGLSACSSLVYTKTKFCIVCWEQIVDTANNPHGDGELPKFFTPNTPASGASAPITKVR